MRSPAIIETHASVLIFLGDRVYKIKKPISLPFLDLRTAGQRRATLSSELHLNRRLSPDVYLGLAEFVEPDGQSEPVLCMRRLPHDRRLSTLIRTGLCTDREVRTIAHDLVAFHQSCEVVAPASTIGSWAHLASLWQDSFEVLEGQSLLFSPGQISAVRTLAADYLDGRWSLLESRRRAGKIRDGHGDLLADDIFLLPDGARILDCLEFDPELRCGDTLLDAAFLAMDIERCGSSTLAQVFLDEYRSRSEDDAPISLAHYYIAYRALVRAKVTVLRVEQGDAAAADDARAFVEIASKHLKAGQVTLTVVSGLPASGKSTLAGLLHERWQATRTCILLQSDVIRDEVAPMRAGLSDGIENGRYSPSARAAVYHAMLQRAESALRSGTDVILDATCTDSWARAAVEDLARSCHARLLALRCQIPAEVAQERLARRIRGAEARSEADSSVYNRLADSSTTWTAAHPINTSAGVDEAYDEVSRLIRQDSPAAM